MAFDAIAVEFDGLRNQAVAARRSGAVGGPGGRGPVSEELEPCRIGLPLARGLLGDPSSIMVEASGGDAPAVQHRVLQRWPDGSIRWCQVDWLQASAQIAVPGATRVVCRQTRGKQASEAVEPAVPWHLTDDEDAALCWLAQGEAIRIHSRIVDSSGGEYRGHATGTRRTAGGPVLSRDEYSLSHRDAAGRVHPLQAWCAVEYFPELHSVVVRLGVRNPQAAGHPNGNWDLGNQGSLYLRDWSLEFELPPSFNGARHTVTAEPGAASHTTDSFRLLQASSGGDNWNSSNHLNRDRHVALAFRGYQLSARGQCHAGRRATPVLAVNGSASQFAFTMQRFWENFPKSLEAHKGRVRLGLFPSQPDQVHELQGGEQKTHTFALYFGPSTEASPLHWFTNPSQPRLSPAYYASTGVIPYLTPRSGDPNTVHHQLVDAAIEGDDRFIDKREKIDEYGWRHYGDIYGDHEAVFHEGPRPLISHYNNQYDCTGGFAWQFFRTGDFRWFDQMVAMADHAWDIDTYHTQGDKNLYNGGLFWHTYHYADADTGTHRSYPRSLTEAQLMVGGKDLAQLGSTGKKLAKNYAIGGGPSASHNYSTGWMWAYFLTGQDDYRHAAINAADYVIRIEDGRKTIFRWLSWADTGHAAESSVGYYGPGRASGNSLQALLTGYELSGDAKYLTMAEKLMQRVAHPEDDLASLDLGNAELRWFYTMYLQALTRYIDIKREYAQFDTQLAYAIATLNHYADWMCEHERPTLDQADRLQYPTETWVAQDMRKWHVLQYAAWLSGGQVERSRKLQAKADDFFDYVCTTLSAMPTRTLCRPVVLMMQFGWQRNWFQRHGDSPGRLPAPPSEGFSAKREFIPQRSIAIRRAKAIVVAGAVATVWILCGWVALLWGDRFPR